MYSLLDRLANPLLSLCRESHQSEAQGVHAFRLLVHADSAAPALEYGDSYGALQVPSDCTTCYCYTCRSLSLPLEQSHS